MEKQRAETCKFNQDNSYNISVYGNTYSIRHTNPFKEIIVKRVELYYKTNIILLVVKNTLYFIDDLSTEKILERDFQGQFKEISQLKTRRDKFFLNTDEGIFYGNFPQTKKEPINLIHLGKTDKNCFDITTVDPDIIAYVGSSQEKKHLKVYNFTSKLNLIIENPHYEGITCITLNNTGSILASSSESGKYIRTWRTDTGQFLKEFYTGASGVPMKLICFNTSNTILVGVLKNNTIVSYDISKHIDQTLINTIVSENNKVLNENDRNKTYSYTSPGTLAKIISSSIYPDGTKSITFNIINVGFTDDITLNCILEDGNCMSLMIDGTGKIC